MMQRWDVDVLISRYVTVTVEAGSRDEALEHAADWKVVGDERPGDTLSVSPIRATPVEHEKNQPA